ncbi:hypothetical protein [Paraburkholderia mimosarum]|uniref:hypothetical protein n=1 Tax=Paraburkholderia mimosarum TaxID=312026 RepID=UPI00138E36F4|nr:hypothetical protein [Paraburkholderia mimosarum]
MEIRVSYEHSLACAPAEFIVLVPSQVIAECAGQRNPESENPLKPATTVQSDAFAAPGFGRRDKRPHQIRAS